MLERHEGRVEFDNAPGWSLTNFPGEEHFGEPTLGKK